MAELDTTSEYWKIQMLLVMLLHNVGIQIQPNHRIQAFRLRQIVVRMEINQDLKDAICEYLDAMVKLRCEGQEPKHERGLYVT